MKKEIITKLKLRECVHVKARSGLGSTTLLKSLPGVYVEPRPLKPIISALAGGKGSIVELKQRINYNQVLLIDDVHEITKQVKNFVSKAINQGLLVVSVGRRNVFRFTELELKLLSFEESVKLVNKHLKNKELSRIIVDEVGGNPGLLMQAVRKAKASDLKTMGGFEQFKKGLNKLVKRKELLSLSLIVMIYPLVQTLRHLFYAQREYQIGHYMAMTAYTIMLLKSMAKKK